MTSLIKYWAVGGLFMALASAAVWADEEIQADNQPAQARIRLYGQNQKPTSMTYRLPNGKKVNVGVGASLGESFSSFIGTAKNTSLGMPKTAMVNNMKRYNGILSKVLYHEFVIPAGTPISVHNSFIGLSTSLPETNDKTGISNRTVTTYTEPSCTGDDITFTAEAGKDYEVVPAHNSRACGVVLLQINADGSTQSLANP